MKAYHDDPLVFEKTTARLGLEWLLAMETAQASLDALAVPTLVLHGGGDIIVPPAVSEPFERLDVVDRVVFPKFRHEILNEPDARKVLETMLNWIRSQLDAEA